jgi:DNA polymerase III subunit epsilon
LKYAIIDVETTGGRPDRERITEIAIVTHDGEFVTETWSTLLNPEKSIPYEITRLTGISNEMVADAPKFFEIAKKVVEMTDGAVFVAHNVRFDFGFVREEFARLGYAFSKKMLCTVRLSRQVFPGLKSYSLSNLKRHFGIHADKSHRALDDTLATVKLFELILAEQSGEGSAQLLVNQGVKEAKLPQGMSIDRLHELPLATGVYYFHDKNGDVIYVGKSINIQKRIFEHFSGMDTKGAKLAAGAVDFSHEITGSELVALLFESAEIKRLRPPINRAQRARYFNGAIFKITDQSGYQQLAWGKNTPKTEAKLDLVADYTNPIAAKAALSTAMRQFELCGKLTHLEATETACFQYHLAKCRGACLQKESVAEYNERVTAAIEYLANRLSGSYFLLEKGRSTTELAVIWVDKGKYQGYGYYDKTFGEPTSEDLFECILPQNHNPEIARIITNYVEKAPSGLRKIRI